MKLLSLRSLFYFGLLLLFIAAIEFKKSSIEEEKAKVVESVLGILIEEGAPVEIKTIEASNIEDVLKVTLFKCGSETACFYKSQAIASHIRPGMKVLKYPEDSLIGRVKQVSKQADYKNGLYKTVVSINNPDKDFKESPNLVAEVLLKKKSNVFTVPVEVVEIDSPKKYIWIVKDRKPERIEVETGIQNEKEIEITKGLSGGEQIIIKGLSQAHEYNHLNIVNGASQSSQPEKTEKPQENI